MPEHEDHKRKKPDLDGEFGFSRRDLLRRGAVVGGTLLWVAPAIQSIAPPAYAHQLSPPTYHCCYCHNGNPRSTTPGQTKCATNGVATSQSACDTFCTGFTTAEYHSGPSPIFCAAGSPCFTPAGPH